VAQQLTYATPTTISLMDGDNPSDSSEVVSTIYLPVDPDEYQPCELGAFICWGANALILIFNSAEGLDAATIATAQAALINHPTLIVITDLDSDQSSFDESLAVCQRVFGEDRQVAAISLPVLNDRELVQGHLYLPTESITWMTSGDTFEQHDLDAEHYDLIGNRMEELFNALTITSLNDEFVTEVLSGEGVEAQFMQEQIVDACKRLELIPVLTLQGNAGLQQVAQLASELGLSMEDAWTPVKHLWLDEPIATVLTNNLIRLWQGKLETSSYLFDGVEGAITAIHTVGGATETVIDDNSIFRASCTPAIAPGTTISQSGLIISPPETNH
jgi:translation elongation factor EF-G